MSAPVIPVATVARMCHEVNRAWCAVNGDLTQLPWDQAEPWQRESAIKGVQVALDGATPEELHQSWCDEKIATGWVFGPRKDPEAKTHPRLVNYSKLPQSQKVKDALFHSTVRALRPEAF